MMAVAPGPFNRSFSAQPYASPGFAGQTPSESYMYSRLASSSPPTTGQFGPPLDTQQSSAASAQPRLMPQHRAQCAPLGGHAQPQGFSRSYPSVMHGGPRPAPALPLPPRAATIVPGRVQSMAAGGWNQLQQATHRMLSQVNPTNRASRSLVQCPICYEDFSETDVVVLSQCRDSKHACCRECVSQYIRGLVNDGRVGAILCPFSRECGASATPEEVRSLTDPETFEKYDRFTKMKQEPTLRQCPKCEALCKPSVDSDGVIEHEMRCEGCGAEFCYLHSDAHVGRPCEEYEEHIAEEERKSTEKAMKGTKLCPNPKCGIITDKVSGCNHMTCTTCKQEWCWMCGEAIEDVMGHYYAGNPLGCQQFTGGGHLDQGPNHVCCVVFIWIMLLPIALVSIVVFFACCLLFLILLPFAFLGACACCGRKTDASYVWMFVAIIAFMPFAWFQFIWAMASGIIVCLLMIPGQFCGCGVQHTQIVLLAPCLSVYYCVMLINRCCGRPPRDEALVSGSSDEGLSDEELGP